MERLTSLQEAASRSSTKRHHNDQVAVGEEPLQHSMKRLRVNASSPTFFDQQHAQKISNYQAELSNAQAWNDRVDNERMVRQNDYAYNSTHQEQQGMQQEVGEGTTSKDAPQAYMPMNRLLGSLHEERRQHQQERDQRSRRTKQLPSNSKLY